MVQEPRIALYTGKDGLMDPLDTVITRHGTYSIKWDGIPLDYTNPDLIPMSIADMDFRAPQEVIDAVVAQAEVGIYGYAMPAECSAAVVTNWLRRRNGWTLREDQVGFVVRVVDAISLAVRALTEEGDGVVVHTPLYSFFETAVEGARRRVVRSPLVRDDDGAYGIDFAAFERVIVKEKARVFILCHPHNPTGRVWQEEELERIIDVCARHGVAIISDDIHSDLIMPGHRYTPIALVAKERGFDQVVTLKSASKTFNLAGLQLGYYLSENAEIMRTIAAEKEYTTYPDLPNNFAIAAMTAAYQHGVPWLEQVISYIHDNYLTLKDLIERKYPRAHLADLQGTYLTWLDVSYLEVTERELAERLDAAGLGAETTSQFGLGEDAGLFIRMNIACPKDTLAQGLEALERALDSL